MPLITTEADEEAKQIIEQSGLEPVPLTREQYYWIFEADCNAD